MTRFHEVFTRGEFAKTALRKTIETIAEGIKAACHREAPTEGLPKFPQRTIAPDIAKRTILGNRWMPLTGPPPVDTESRRERQLSVQRSRAA